MRLSLSAALTLSTLALALPASAGTVYVPLLDPSGNGASHLTEIWISNIDTAQRSFTATFLQENTDGTKRAAAASPINVQAGRTIKLTGLVQNGKMGMLEIDSVEKVAFEVRLTNTASNGQVSYSSVPVISSDNLFDANSTALVQGLGRNASNGESGDFGIMNLSKTAGRCEVKFFRTDGMQVAATASLTFPALSIRYFPDALFILGLLTVSDIRAQVSCDQSFSVFATYRRQSDAMTFFIPASANGSSTLTGPGGGGGTTPPPTTGGLVFTAPGTFHVASRENEKKTFDIPVQRALTLKQLIVEVDFTPGPWNTSKPNPNHAIAWIHRGRFRSNSVINLNAFGPSKYAVKMNQNVDMPAGQVTVGEAGIQLQRGTLYHAKTVYDAQAGKATVTISSGGAVLRQFTLSTTAANRILNVPSDGLVAEFGHYSGQEGPEVPSWGWAYANLRVQMVPY